MTDDDKRPFMDAMMALAARYGEPMPGPRIRQYFDSLTGYQITEVVAAVARHVAAKFPDERMPDPAGLVALIKLEDQIIVMEGAMRPRHLGAKAVTAWAQIEVFRRHLAACGCPERAADAITAAELVEAEERIKARLLAEGGAALLDYYKGAK